MVRGRLSGGFLAGPSHVHQMVGQAAPEPRSAARGPQLLQGVGEDVLEVQLEEPELPVGDAHAVAKSNLVERNLEQVFESFLGQRGGAGV